MAGEGGKRGWWRFEQGGNTTTYNWDYESHLVSIDYPGTSNDDTHEYDGDGRRMRSKLSGASDWTNFVHEEVGGALLAEYTLISGTFTIKCLYTSGLGLVSTNREGTKRYFHFDGLGSTWALTDENENVTDNYGYSAFGVTVSATSTNGPSTNPMRFGGRWRYYDDGAMAASSGLSLLGVRYLSITNGRFWSWDPIPNRYAYLYVQNRSTMEADPSGLIIPIIIGGAMCATSSRQKNIDWNVWHLECVDCCKEINKNDSLIGYDPKGFADCVKYFCTLHKNPCVCAFETQ